MPQEVININVYDVQEEVTINVTDEVTTVDVNIIQSTGAVSSVNGQTGTVTLNADNIDDTTTSHKFVSASERTAITHSNRTILDQISEAFTTALKSTYDAAVALINNHTANTNNPHSTTATQVDALKRDGSNANSNIDLGTYSLNAKSFKANGTGGAGNISLKHQSSNATAGGQETALFAGSDGELYYKNDGNPLAQVASRAWVSAQGFITNVITALGYTPANKAGDTFTGAISATNLSGTNTGDETATTIRTKLGISTLSGSNTGDETRATIISKLLANPSFRLIKDGALSSSVTGTTANTIVSTYKIDAGRISATDVAELSVKAIKSGTAGSFTLSCYANTAANLTGASLVFTNPVSTGTNIHQQVIRTLAFRGGNLVVYPASLGGLSDLSTTSQAMTSFALNPANDWYLIFTLQNGNTADTTNISHVLFTN